MRSVKILIVGVVMMACMACSVVEAKDVSVLQETGSAFAAIAKQALPAVVFVNVDSTVEVEVPRYRGNDPFEQFYRWQNPYNQPRSPGIRKYHQQGQGSGFIISKDGYILTNNHVINNADNITVTLGDGRKFEAVLVGTDPETEVALIKIEDDSDFPYLELGDSDALDVGEWVLAAGNPFGLSQTITAGIVSAKERSEVGITEYADFIQTDAAINPGNSGGPLLNIHGEVVGNNTAIYSQTGGYMGIGFAIPINQAVAIKDQLIAYGEARHSVLGIYIQEVDEELAERFGLEESGGILISQVKQGSAADAAGLKTGDIVVELNGEETGRLQSFRSRIATTPPDTEVALKIFRDGEYMNISAVTQAMGSEGAMAGDAPGSGALEKLGLSVQDMDEETFRRWGYPEYGVMISDVVQYSAAWRAGLRHGQIILSVNRNRIENAEEFTRILNSSAGDGRVLLLVSDGRGARYVVLSMN